MNDRIRRLYLVALGREPTPGEVDADRRLLVELAGPTGKTLTGPTDNSTQLSITAWAGLCHVVLASNEFVYLR